MAGLAKSVLDRVIILLSTPGPTPAPSEWAAQQAFAAQAAGTCVGMLILPDGPPPNAEARVKMQTLVTSLPHLRVAWVTDSPTVGMFVNTIAAQNPELTERLHKTDSLAAALSHLKVPAYRLPNFQREIVNLRRAAMLSP